MRARARARSARRAIVYSVHGKDTQTSRASKAGAIYSIWNGSVLDTYCI